MLHAWIEGFVAGLLPKGRFGRRWQSSFELNVAYDRGATAAEAVTFWREWKIAGAARPQSRFRWWLRTRAMQRESLRRSTSGRSYSH